MKLKTARIVGLHLLGLFLLPLLAALMGLGLTSCTLPAGQRAALTQAADIALTAGVITGRITPAQAELVRTAGALILTEEAGPEKVVAISQAAVNAAEATGRLTPDQAAELREAGQVALPPEPVLLPTVTASK